MIFADDLLLLGGSPEKSSAVLWMRPSQIERRYLLNLSRAYRNFFQDRFIHQAMELVEEPERAKSESLYASLSEDPLLIELVALMDEPSLVANNSITPIEDTRTQPIANLQVGLSEYHTIALLGESGSGKTSSRQRGWCWITWKTAPLHWSWRAIRPSRRVWYTSPRCSHLPSGSSSPGVLGYC